MLNHLQQRAGAHTATSIGETRLTRSSASAGDLLHSAAIDSSHTGTEQNKIKSQRWKAIENEERTARTPRTLGRSSPDLQVTEGKMIRWSCGHSPHPWPQFSTDSTSSVKVVRERETSKKVVMCGHEQRNLCCTSNETIPFSFPPLFSSPGARHRPDHLQLLLHCQRFFVGTPQLRNASVAPHRWWRGELRRP